MVPLEKEVLRVQRGLSSQGRRGASEHVGLFWHNKGLLWHNKRLFKDNVGLFWHKIVLSSQGRRGAFSQGRRLSRLCPSEKLLGDGLSTPVPLFCLICTIISNKTGIFD